MFFAIHNNNVKSLFTGWIFPTLLGLALLTAPSVTLAYEGGAVSGGGKIVGTVKYAGPKVKVKKLAVTKDKKACGKPKDSQELVVGKKKALRFAVISISDIKKGKEAKKGKPVLDQKSCEYVPHVQAALKGSKLKIINSDPVLHNVHSYHANKRTAFNLAMPIQNQKIKKKLKKTGVISINCDAGHTWMSAYVVVFDHPYFAVSDARGQFELNDVPPGTYTLELWHEKLGKQTQKVTVASGKSATVEFSLK